MTPNAPAVYFIDDSATMREVIKIAFRRENMNVIACHDGTSALAQMEELQPDVVISDVIMPDKDGYQVCEHIKTHAQLCKTPVILMSGVVNRAVAERSFAVKADELIRKPFEPQDLISRVKRLLGPRALPAPPAAAISANAALSSIFATSASNIVPMTRPAGSAGPGVNGAFASIDAKSHLAANATALPRTPAPPLQPAPSQPPGAMVSLSRPAAGTPPTAATVPPLAAPPPVLPAERTSGGVSARKNGMGAETQGLRIEVLRLQGLVRKLQSELQAEREYVSALEAHIKTLQEAE